MQRIILLSIFLFSVFSLHCSEPELAANAYFVSLNGNDAWSGKLKQPNKNKTDGPFATLDKAKEAIRKQISKKGISGGRITVYIRGGVYTIHRTFQLSREDSGLESLPIIWRAYPGETVRFIGSKNISAFKKITDANILARIAPSCRSKILQINLKEQGITDFGEMKMTGMGLPIQPTGLELYFKGKAMTLARYPNEGWLQIKDVPQFGKRLIHAGISHTPKDGIPRGRHYGRFKYSGDRPERWQKSDDIWMHGYWTWDWADAFIKIARIDLKKREIYPAEPHYRYGYTKEQRFYFLNILEELDSPGEYYLDRKTGILYFWPPQPIGEQDAFVSLLNQDMIHLKNAENISVENIIFEGGRANAVKIEGGKNSRIAGCTIRNMGNAAVVVEGGFHNGVQSCDIYDTGDGGIRIDGGDRQTLTPGHNYATNNHIFRFSRIDLTYRHAIRLNGVGNIASHNLIHDAPHEAIYFSGNEHLIEYNEIYNIVKETGDAGAIHTGRDYTWRGNVIRFNYFHDLHGPGLFGVMGVYLDDFMSGTTVYGNVFYKAGRAAFLGGGRDNLIENNIFIDCQASVHIDARGTTWAKNYFDGRYNILTERMKAVHYDQPPYSERYPELLSYYDDDPAVPKNNKVYRNVSFSKIWLDIEDGVDAELLDMKNNVIADSILCYWRGPELKDAKTGTVYTREDSSFVKKLFHNVIMEGNPGFRNIAHKNFQLNNHSPAFKNGFKKIPFDKIGLYIDKYRKKLVE